MIVRSDKRLITKQRSYAALQIFHNENIFHIIYFSNIVNFFIFFNLRLELNRELNYWKEIQ